MKTYFPLLMVLIILCSPLISACSSEQERKEKGAIEQGTEKVAKEAVKAIKTPLDQAKSSAKQENDYGREVEEQVQK